MQDIKNAQLTLLYHPINSKPMHVVVFGSGSGQNLDYLLNYQKSNPSSIFQIKALASNRCCRFQNFGRQAGIPVIYHSFFQFCKEKKSPSTDLQTRQNYDDELAELITACAKRYHFEIDLIILAGYMQIVTPVLLERFKNKIINIHPADLTILKPNGSRAFTGQHTVHQALLQGTTRTRSSIHLVDEGIDSGPVLVSGPWVHYTGTYPVSEEQSNMHQEKQKKLSDWPACLAAVNLIGNGKLGLDEERNVYIDGILQPPEGYDLNLNSC